MPLSEGSLRSGRACGWEGHSRCSRPLCGRGCPSMSREDESSEATKVYKWCVCVCVCEREREDYGNTKL